MCLIGFSSCQEKEVFEKNNSERPSETSYKEGYMTEFASILSKAVYARKDLREFLKQESLKQFDKNYDVLYYLVKDELIGNESFRDVLISFSSAAELEKIEMNVPLLNIYVSRIDIFDVLPENLDTDDTEIPIIVVKKSENALYLNGINELSFDKGEVPNFHVFVINENSRVILPANSHHVGARKMMMFKSPAFDGTNKASSTDARISSSNQFVGQKAIDAFKYFYKDDGSINQKAFQRDFIYYGITPQNRTGSINHSVTEYIQYLEVNPSAYFTISDQREDKTYNNDPYILQTTVERKRSGYTEAELVNKMWSVGAYNFRFEVISIPNKELAPSESMVPSIVYIPLKPQEIWNFNIEYTRRHSTWFRRSKHTYTIDPANFTSKTVILSNPVTLGKWDISKESLTRYVRIFEEDEGIEITHEESQVMAFAHKSNFNGSTKISLGLKDVVSGEQGVAGGVESSTSETRSIKTITKRNQGSDALGQVKMYFYDPVIQNVTASSNTSIINTYNSGVVSIGMVVK